MKIAIPTLIVVCGLSCGCRLPSMFAAAPSSGEKPPTAPPTEAQAQAAAQAQMKARLAKMKIHSRPKAPVKAASSAAHLAAAPVAVTLTSDKKRYKRGQVVSFKITARNTSKKPQKLGFTSGQNFDLAAQPAVYNGNPATMPRWNWSYGRFFIQSISEMTLAPNTSKSWTATWNQADNNGKQLPRGAYRIEARLTANNDIKARPITITLVD